MESQSLTTSLKQTDAQAVSEQQPQRQIPPLPPFLTLIFVAEDDVMCYGVCLGNVGLFRTNWNIGVLSALF